MGAMPADSFLLYSMKKLGRLGVCGYTKFKCAVKLLILFSLSSDIDHAMRDTVILLVYRRILYIHYKL